MPTRVEKILPVLQQAFQQVRSHLQQEKQKQRVLDFIDLEVHALKALQSIEARGHYAKRWRVFLIDEFQDTNPVQGNLLQALTQDAISTIVRRCETIDSLIQEDEITILTLAQAPQRCQMGSIRGS